MAGTTPGPPGTPGTPRVLRAMNDRAALDLLLEHGPLSRTRIGKLTGLSKPTASQLLARLEAAGLVVATGTSEGRPGPNAQLYTVNARAAHVAGLDVNGQRIVAAVADVTGRTVGRFELATPGRRADRVVRQVADALDGAVKDAGLTRGDVHRLVIGTPGAFDPGTGRLRYASHLPGWHSPPCWTSWPRSCRCRWSTRTTSTSSPWPSSASARPAATRTSCCCGTRRASAPPSSSTAKLHRGFTGGAGEVGFLPVPGTPLVRQVVRANSGGFQELAGAQAVPRLAKALGIDTPQQPYAKVAAELLTRAADAYEQDEALTELLRQYAQRLATGLASVTAVLDPGLIVLSGEAVAAGGEILRSLIQSELAELAASRPRLVVGEIDREPVLRGALERALADTRDEVFDTSR